MAEDFTEIKPIGKPYIANATAAEGEGMIGLGHHADAKDPNYYRLDLKVTVRMAAGLKTIKHNYYFRTASAVSKTNPALSQLFTALINTTLKSIEESTGEKFAWPNQKELIKTIALLLNRSAS